jgi:hypothetical protein
MLYNIITILAGITIFVIVNIGLAFYKFPKDESIKKQIYLPDDKHHYKNEVKYILAYTENSNVESGGLWGTVPENYFKELECPEHRCILTNDRTLKKEHQYDAIIFNGTELNNITNFPEFRSPHQVYVFAMTESPPSNFQLEPTYILFNMTSKNLY